VHDHFNKHLDVEGLLRAARPRLVVELGAGSGLNTVLLAPLCKEFDARLIVISDGRRPEGLVEEVDWIWGISYLAMMSFDEGSIDAAIIDTDHNSWTVDQELRVLKEKMREGGLVLLHDTEAFKLNNGFMYAYGCGVRYPLEEIMREKRTYSEAVREWIGPWFEVVKETTESNGAMALRRTDSRG